MRGLIAFAVITLALLVEYAFSSGGVLRWLERTVTSVELPAEVAEIPEPPAPPDPAPVEPAPPAPAPPPPPAPSAAAPAAAPAPASFGIRTLEAKLPAEVDAWLKWLKPGLPKLAAQHSGSAIANPLEIHRPPYGYGTDGQALKDLDVDSYQVLPVVGEPPLAVALLFSDGKLHNWLLYEQNTRGLAEDQAHMLALYASHSIVKRAGPAAADDGNMLVDPSFETEPGADEADFEFDAAGGDALGARTGDAAHSGRFALVSRASRGANRGWPGWKSGDRFPVRKGEVYVLRARTMSPDGANAWLDLQLYDAAGTWLGGRSGGCAKDRPHRNEWEPVELRLLTQHEPRVASVRLGLLQCLNHSQGRTTTLYFDDVYFGVMR